MRKSGGRRASSIIKSSSSGVAVLNRSTASVFLTRMSVVPGIFSSSYFFPRKKEERLSRRHARAMKPLIKGPKDAAIGVRFTFTGKRV